MIELTDMDRLDIVCRDIMGQPASLSEEVCEDLLALARTMPDPSALPHAESLVAKGRELRAAGVPVWQPPSHQRRGTGPETGEAAP